MNVGSLFAGIGGFDLGFERAGMRVSWQVERDAHCRAVLARHFADAVRFEDVREVGAQNLAPVDLICGGFPCQDLSSAGRGAGLDGARSGLWSEFARIVCELRPRYVVVENVPALLTGKGKRWDRAPVGRVLGDLAEAGYDAEWACLSAREFGAPHLRKRVWIVAYPAWDAEAGAAAATRAERERAGLGSSESGARDLPDTDTNRRPEGICIASGSTKQTRSGDSLGGGSVAAWSDPQGDPERAGLCGSGSAGQRRRRPGDGGGARGDQLADTNPRRFAECAAVDSQPRTGCTTAESRGHVDGSRSSEGNPWRTEPDVGRVADGVPARVDRLAALGNALLPQIAEWIGRRIVLCEQEKKAGGVAR